MPVEGIERLALRQKFTLGVNRFAVHKVASDGTDGELIAFAQQKRLAFKELVTFYTDEARTTPVFSFKARSVMDLGATYDVTDAAGNPLGLFRKDFGASLLRSTFVVETPAVTATGQERNFTFALLRRVADLPLPIHFDFADPSGTTIMSVERKFAIRDSYQVSIPGGRLDWRVAAAMAVGLDVLMGR